jgi:hypothetical protein
MITVYDFLKDISDLYKNCPDAGGKIYIALMVTTIMIIGMAAILTGTSALGPFATAVLVSVISAYMLGKFIETIK